MIVLTPLGKFQFPIHAECINPDVFKEKSVAEIASLSVWEGNRKKTLGDLFKIEEVSGETASITINAFSIPPTRSDKSTPAFLNALPETVLSKLFSKPSFSIILFAAFPTIEPMK